MTQAPIRYRPFVQLCCRKKKTFKKYSCIFIPQTVPKNIAVVNSWKQVSKQNRILFQTEYCFIPVNFKPNLHLFFWFFLRGSVQMLPSVLSFYLILTTKFLFFCYRNCLNTFFAPRFSCLLLIHFFFHFHAAFKFCECA